MRLLIDVCRKFNSILSRHQKIRIAELVVIMLIGGFLETLSVTVILPFMQVVLNPREVMSKPLVSRVCDILGIHSDRSFLVLLSILIALMYIFKNLFLLLEYNIQYRFVFNNRFALQQKLLHTILMRPYQYFLHASSGDIMRLISGDSEAAFDILVNVLNLFTELVVAGMLIVTILIVSPFITICIAVILLLLMVAIYTFMRPIQIDEGKKAQLAETGKNKWLIQAVQGIKEIKVSYREAFFEKQYEYFGLMANTSRRKNQLMSISPRFFIEAFSMATMFIVIAFLMYRGMDFEMIIPTLTVVAMAAVRILPSTNRIALTMSNITFQKPRLDTFVENLNNLNTEMESAALPEYTGERSAIDTFEHKVEFKNITFSYNDAKGNVFDNASMEILKGESVGIVGASGSGKTTAVDIILGLLVPRSGSVLIDGRDIRGDMPGWLSLVGYIPQMIFMLDGSIRENVIFGDSGSNDPEDIDTRVWEALKEASLDEFVRELPEGLDTRIGERGVRLSGGQRQRIGIARALYRNHEILVFDEATSALDNETESSIMESINSFHGHKTMIIIAHRLTTIEACDRIYRVEDGRIIPER